MLRKINKIKNKFLQILVDMKYLAIFIIILYLILFK